MSSLSGVASGAALQDAAETSVSGEGRPEGDAYQVVSAGDSRSTEDLTEDVKWPPKTLNDWADAPPDGGHLDGHAR